jgi:DNA polymerase III subunit delta'
MKAAKIEFKSSASRGRHARCDSLISHCMFFRDVIGQEAVKQRLIKACREGRVSHALLFFGPKGSGTLPLALAFTQYINCENPSFSDSCGVCSSCVKMNKMVHPDVHYTFPIAVSKTNKVAVSNDLVADFREAVLANPYLNNNDWMYAASGDEGKAGVIPTEEGLDIIRMISLKAFEGKYKVVIIWMPEKMNLASANKLLKSLEEPPDKTVFILATEQRDQLLATILSRTQLVKLQRISDVDIANKLVMNGLEDKQALFFAQLSDGDYREALELSARESGTGSAEKDFLSWMRLCFSPAKNMEKLLSWVDGMQAEGREGQKQFLFSCMAILRECILLGNAGGDLVRLLPEQRVALERFVPFVNSKNSSDFSAALNEAYFHVERNANAKILFLDLSLKISRILQIK